MRLLHLPAQVSKPESFEHFAEIHDKCINYITLYLLQIRDFLFPVLSVIYPAFFSLPVRITDKRHSKVNSYLYFPYPFLHLFPKLQIKHRFLRFLYVISDQTGSSAPEITDKICLSGIFYP
jgi:hypothetical protein